MYKNVIDPGKSVYFILKDIDIGGQNQYAISTGPSLIILFERLLGFKESD